MSASRSDHGDANRDPLTGSHPVGTGVGAAIGGAVDGPVGTMVGGATVGGLTGHGIAEAVNPTIEDAYWRENYRTRPYVDLDRTYEEYQPAYRYGWESYARYAGRRWEESEADLERGWEKARGSSRLSWNDAKHAVRDAWKRVGSSLTVADEDVRWRYDTHIDAMLGRGSFGIGETSGTSSSSTGRNVPPPPPPSPVLRRTPHMEIVPPPPLTASELFTVLIYADTQPARAGERAREIAVDAPAEIRRFKFEVFLRPSAHFRIEGPQSGTLVLERDKPRSRSVGFELRVVENPGHVAGPPEIVAYFYYGHLPSGVVARQIHVAGLPNAPTAVDWSDDVVADLRAVPADLQVDVLKNTERIGREFTVRVRTALLPAYREWKTETWKLSSDTKKLVANYMKEFISSELTNEDRLLQLEGAGIELFDAAPKGFRRIFWELLDAGARLETISIVSEEPFIPWELMVPTRWKEERRERRKPLGIEFSISRWSSRDHVSPPPRIPLSNSVVMAPRDSKLEQAESEATIVLEAFPGTRIVPAAVQALDRWLQETDTSLLHFVCHGENRAIQLLRFENGQVLTTTRLIALEGLVRALSAVRPLIFLNACEVGRPKPDLVGVGGFAEHFMQLRAGGVIAPLWSVRDSIAHEIAVEFYRRVKAEPGVPFAQILRDIRAKAYAEGEDTYAAYCFYGDPRATAAGG